ncbi:MAG: GGDEF domain-containing protein [Eubacterium sp.]|nr:GGDEF domain-containing protein [Eubacterium sp.]
MNSRHFGVINYCGEVFAWIISHEIRNIILYVVRYQQELVGFIWAANYDTEKMMKIKETLELSSFLIAAVISNHQLVSQLEIKSTVDRLTKVSNRNAMNERMDSFTSSEEKMPEAMGVVFADLNGLKIVNDDEGHDAGDRLLERAAALLKIAFGDQEIYRAGGDEFVVICPNIEEDKMNEQVSQLRGLANNTNDVSFAVGTAYCTGKYSILKAVQIADENMYKDKTEYYRNNPEKDRRRQGKSAE